MFVEVLFEVYLLMFVEEEGWLNDNMIWENFIEWVFVYDDWMQNVVGDNFIVQVLINFYICYKFQFLVYFEKIYWQFGLMLGDLKFELLEVIVDCYIYLFMEVMSKKVSWGLYMNVMQYLMGFLKDVLGDEECKVMLEQMEVYCWGEVLFVVFMILLCMVQCWELVDYLSVQYYFILYFDELGLCNNV